MAIIRTVTDNKRAHKVREGTDITVEFKGRVVEYDSQGWMIVRDEKGFSHKIYPAAFERNRVYKLDENFEPGDLVLAANGKVYERLSNSGVTWTDPGPCGGIYEESVPQRPLYKLKR